MVSPMLFLVVQNEPSHSSTLLGSSLEEFPLKSTRKNHGHNLGKGLVNLQLCSSPTRPLPADKLNKLVSNRHLAHELLHVCGR